MCYIVSVSAACRRKWHDDYYWMLEKEFGNERARLVAESMTCGPKPDPYPSCLRCCYGALDVNALLVISPAPQTVRTATIQT